MELPKSEFEKIIDELKAEKERLYRIRYKRLKRAQFKALYKERMGQDFPSEPKRQLLESIKAVFRS